MTNGRPSSYSPEYAEQARRLCNLGATDYELADFFGVHTATIYRWRNEFKDFCEAVKVGKEFCDERVVRSLYNRAVGYSFESEKVFSTKDGGIVRADIVEHVPPDTGAAMNWLKNRRREDWQEKVVNEHTGKDGGAIQITDETRVRALAAFLAKTAGK